VDGVDTDVSGFCHRKRRHDVMTVEKTGGQQGEHNVQDDHRKSREIAMKGV
jgi:hypothetical protein